jgi:hypothetical protein
MKMCNLEKNKQFSGGGDLRRFFFFFPVPVCAITAPGVPGGTLVSMNRFSALCG